MKSKSETMLTTMVSIRVLKAVAEAHVKCAQDEEQDDCPDEDEVIHNYLTN